MRNLTASVIRYTSGTLLYHKQKRNDIVIQTQADEKEALELCVKTYALENIRNFNYDENGKLKWVVLDDSVYVNDDPNAEPTMRCVSSFSLYIINVFSLS